MCLSFILGKDFVEKSARSAALTSNMLNWIIDVSLNGICKTGKVLRQTKFHKKQSTQDFFFFVGLEPLI